MLLTIYHPAFKLLGITTTHGNVGLDKTTYNALAFLANMIRRGLANMIRRGLANMIRRGLLTSTAPISVLG
jgi:inosine-uridine nucleoside N-ribohydrolase